MNTKILFAASALLALNAGAQTTSALEEAIILNQELQFLEESASNIRPGAAEVSDTPLPRSRAINDESLERTYFTDAPDTDTVRTRTAAPKRRGF